MSSRGPGRHNFTNSLFAPATDPSALAFFNAVQVAGGSVSFARQPAYNTLFTKLRAKTLLPTLTCLQLLAAENSISSYMDLIRLTSATPQGTGTLTADQGYAGNGSTGYLDTNYNPFGSSIVLQNSAVLGVCTLTSRAGGADYCNIGIDGAGAQPRTDFYQQWTDTNMYASLTSGTFGTANVGANARGFWTMSRTGAGGISIYKDLATYGTTSDASGGVTNGTVLINATRTSGALVAWSADQNAAAWVASGWTAQQASDFATIINEYLASLPVPMNIF